METENLTNDTLISKDQSLITTQGEKKMAEVETIKESFNMESTDNRTDVPITMKLKEASNLVKASKQNKNSAITMENKPVNKLNNFGESAPVEQEADGCRKRFPDIKTEKNLDDVTETSLADKPSEAITNKDLPEEQDDEKPESDDYLEKEKLPQTDKPVDIIKDKDNPIKQCIHSFTNVFTPPHYGFVLMLIRYFVPYLSIMYIMHVLYESITLTILLNLLVMLLVYSILTVVACSGLLSLLVQLLVFLCFGGLYYLAMDYRWSDYLLILCLIYGCIIMKGHVLTAIWFCFNNCLLGVIVVTSSGDMMVYNEMMFIICVVLFTGNLCHRPYIGKVQMMGMAVCSLVVLNLVVYFWGYMGLELLFIKLIGINTILGFLLSFEVVRQELDPD